MIDFSLHLEAMAWLRYGKQFAYVASEAGFFNADVLGSDGKKLIEVEVKKTKSDFANDFRNKPWKHMFYGKPVESQLAWVPNQFYFLVPAKLEVEALKILLDNDSPAGLLVLDRPMTGIYGRRRQAFEGHSRSAAERDRARQARQEDVVRSGDHQALPREPRPPGPDRSRGLDRASPGVAYSTPNPRLGVRR